MFSSVRTPQPREQMKTKLTTKTLPITVAPHPKKHPRVRRTVILPICAALLITPTAFAGLIAQYQFNGNGNDTSGNGLNGVVNGATLTTDRFGNPNSAYQFASGQSISFPTLPVLGGAHSAFTVSLWFQANGLGPLFGDYQGTATGGDNIYAMEAQIDNNPIHSSAPNYLSIDSRNYPTHSLDYTLYSGSNPIIGTGWHALAYEFDGTSSANVFLDGTQVASLPYDASLNYSQSPNWQAGHNYFAGADQYFTGKIDDIQIYDSALSQSQIQQIQGVPEPAAFGTIAGLILLGIGASTRRRNRNVRFASGQQA